MNGFNKLGLQATLWTVRHRWAAGAWFTFNCYRHSALLILRWKGQPGYTLLSGEGVTQGDPQSMGHGLALVATPRAPGGCPGSRGAHRGWPTRPWSTSSAWGQNGAISLNRPKASLSATQKIGWGPRSDSKPLASSLLMATANLGRPPRLAASSALRPPSLSGSGPISHNGSGASDCLQRWPAGTPKPPMPALPSHFSRSGNTCSALSRTPGRRSSRSRKPSAQSSSRPCCR
jgi:hypothetical protein